MVKPNPDEQQPTKTCDGDPLSTDEQTRVIPEMEEVADISKRIINTGTVRITKQIEEVERTFHPSLNEQHVRIERVPINRVVKTAPETRTEGTTTIIPVLEEVVVKLILLKEEIRITRENVEKPGEPQHVTLRREHVDVQRASTEAERDASLHNETGR